MDWKEEILHHMWKRMKLNECLVGEWLLDYFYRDYEFPNGLAIRTMTQTKPYAKVTIYCNIEDESNVSKLLDQSFPKKKEKRDNRLKIESNVRSKRYLDDLLWGLYRLYQD